MLTLGEGAKVAKTARTYRSACERFARWLVEADGALAGPEAMTLEAIASYEAELRARGLAEATVHKDRSAINRLVRHLASTGIARGSCWRGACRRAPPASASARRRSTSSPGAAF